MLASLRVAPVPATPPLPAAARDGAPIVIGDEEHRFSALRAVDSACGGIEQGTGVSPSGPVEHPASRIRHRSKSRGQFRIVATDWTTIRCAPGDALPAATWPPVLGRAAKRPDLIARLEMAATAAASGWPSPTCAAGGIMVRGRFGLHPTSMEGTDGT